MRKIDKNGIPITSEFIDELDTIFCLLDQRLQDGDQLSREEMAVIDVYDTIGHVEGDGLHQFWTGCDDPSRVLESFQLVGAEQVAKKIEETRWILEIIDKGVDSKGHYKFTKEEENRLDKSEELVYELFIGIPMRLFEYAKHNMING